MPRHIILTVKKCHVNNQFHVSHKHLKISTLNVILREFGIRSLCNNSAFVNDVNIQRRFLRQEVVRNESCNEV